MVKLGLRASVNCQGNFLIPSPFLVLKRMRRISNFVFVMFVWSRRLERMEITPHEVIDCHLCMLQNVFHFPFLQSSMSKQDLATCDTNCYSCLLNSSSAFVASCLFGQGGIEILKLIFCTSTSVHVLYIFFIYAFFSQYLCILSSLPCNNVSAL